MGRLTRLLPQPLVDFLYRHRARRLLRAVRGWTARALGETRQGVPITRGPLAGYRLAFSDSVAMWIGGHESAVAVEIERRLKPGGVAWDIGAHVGYSVMIMAKAVGPTGRVIGYEPDPDNHELLRRNIDLNGLGGFVEARAVALGSEESSGSLHRGELSILTQVRADAGGSVSISTIDAEVFDHGVPVPDLVLVDVEGMEEAVFLGGRRFLAEHSPAIILEAGPPSVVRLLADLGYAGVAVDVDHVLFEKTGT